MMSQMNLVHNAARLAMADHRVAPIVPARSNRPLARRGTTLVTLSVAGAALLAAVTASLLHLLDRI